MNCENCENYTNEDDHVFCQADRCSNPNRTLLLKQHKCGKCKSFMGIETRERIEDFKVSTVACFQMEVPEECKKFHPKITDCCGDCHYSVFYMGMPEKEIGEYLFCRYEPVEVKKEINDWCGKFKKAESIEVD